MSQTDRDGASTTPPTPPPQLQEVLDAALAAQAAAEAAALAAANTPVAAPTNAAATKATPVDDDELPLIDSAAGFILKKLTWTNLKLALVAQWAAISDSIALVKGSSDATKLLRFEVDGFSAATTRVITPANRDVLMGLLSHGQCRLAKSGANLVLSPYNGNKLIINGQFEDIPDAGVSLAPPATTLTLYYIYAYMNAGVMTLEASTTSYSAQTNTGIMVKTGDATRTLVGMARTVTNAWVDTTAARLVRSWFNDEGIGSSAAFTANRSTSSATYGELNTEIRNEVLTWANEVVTAVINGSSLSTAAGSIFTSMAIDSATVAEDVSSSTSNVAGGLGSINLILIKTGLVEGYHYFTLLARVTSSSANWQGGSTLGERCTLQVRAKK